MHLHNYFQTKLSALLQSSYRRNWIWKVNWSLQFRKLPTHEKTIMSQRQNPSFCIKKLPMSSEVHFLEPGLYPSISSNMNTVEAMNTLIQEKHNHCESCITVKVSRGTQKTDVYFANGGSCLAFLSTDLGHVSINNVGFEFGVMMRKERPHKLEFAYDFLSKHSLIYRDLIEYNVVSDTKTPFMRCFFFISELKAGKIVTTGQYMTYQTFSNLQFRPLLKNSFQSFHKNLGDTGGEKKSLYLSVSLVIVWCSEQPPTSICNFKNTLQDGCFKTSSWWYLVVARTRNLTYYLTWWKLHRFWFSNGTEILRWFEADVISFETENREESWLRNLQYQKS